MTHNLKITPQYFEDIVNGYKTFELRKNDRDYKLGDTLILQEFFNNTYTGNEFVCNINYILKNCSEYGLQEGFVILGI
ncbi:MAG: DUF3850 domain-containing protein [Bacteroidia bacterium]